MAGRSRCATGASALMSTGARSTPPCRREPSRIPDALRSSGADRRARGQACGPAAQASQSAGKAKGSRRQTAAKTVVADRARQERNRRAPKHRPAKKAATAKPKSAARQAKIGRRPAIFIPPCGTRLRCCCRRGRGRRRRNSACGNGALARRAIVLSPAAIAARWKASTSARVSAVKATCAPPLGLLPGRSRRKPCGPCRSRRGRRARLLRRDFHDDADAERPEGA